MPATRSPARQTMVSFHRAGALSPQSYEAQLHKGIPTKAPIHNTAVPATKPSTIKRRRSPNAFILFRSFIIANKLLPPEITHQNDVSCVIAMLWRSSSASDRSVFFRKAEQEKLRFALEGPSEVYRNKRVRIRKARSSIAAEQVTLINPSEDTTAASKGPLSPLAPPGISPSSYLFPLNTLSPVPCPWSSCLPANIPIAPQPKPAIPPSLLNWGRPADVDTSNTNNQDLPTSNDYLQMEPSSFSSLLHQIHAEPRAPLYMSLIVGTDFYSASDSMTSSQMLPRL